jgi:DNA-3-methyladenine glycosylase II
MSTFTLQAQGPFSLAASTRFLEGFTPAAFTGAVGQPLEIAFPVEGTWQTAGVRAGEHAGGVACEIVSPAVPGKELLAAVRTQVARILSLDVDGSGFPGIGERDPVAGGLQRRYPGLRPVGFWSPYEAAAWAIIGHRIRIRQAATIKAGLSRQLGEPVSFGDHVVHAFPAPERLATLDGFPGLAGRKPQWLRSIAGAALNGDLDASRLLALPPDESIAQLKQLPGIGDFSAELVLLRGAGSPDRLPRHESRLARAVALAYDLPQPPTSQELERISDNWRPYRTWTTVLLRAYLEDQTGEIRGLPALSLFRGRGRGSRDVGGLTAGCRFRRPAPERVPPAALAVAVPVEGSAVVGRAAAHRAGRIGARGLPLVEQFVAFLADRGGLPLGPGQPAAGLAAPAGGTARPRQQQAEPEHAQRPEDDAVEEQPAGRAGHVIAEHREGMTERMRGPPVRQDAAHADGYRRDQDDKTDNDDHNPLRNLSCEISG